VGNNRRGRKVWQVALNVFAFFSSNPCFYFFKIASIELLVGKNDFTAIQNLAIFIF